MSIQRDKLLQKFEEEYESICIEHNISVLNYYALASGFLTGKYRSEDDLGKSSRGGGIKKYLNQRGLAILDALDTVSKEFDTTQASVAIAWLLAKPAVTAPIASATSTQQLETLINGVNLKLPKEAVELLDKASDWH